MSQPSPGRSVRYVCVWPIAMAVRTVSVGSTMAPPGALHDANPNASATIKARRLRFAMLPQRARNELTMSHPHRPISAR